MNLKDTLRPGMRLVGPDNHDYGAVERYDDTSVYANGRRIPFGAIERVDHDRLYLDTAGTYSLIEQDTADIGTDSQVRVPVTEERLEVGKRQIDLGEIRIHKTVEEVEQVRRGPLHREEVEIERVRVNRRVTVPEERRQEGEWLVIPVMEEVFVVEKRLVVMEEIRIRKQLMTEDREVRETVRREHASIDETRAEAPGRPTSNTDAGGDGAAWDELHAEIRGIHR
jgi:uncharacterized protein (TIGR02271 family)